MFLYDIFSPEFIDMNLEAEDKDEVFEELVDRFCQATHSTAREEILQSVKDRESKMSTGIQKGVAIPHGKTNAVDKLYGMLGISRKGIDYESLDGSPVYLLFLVLAPPQDSETHLLVLQRLSELLSDPRFTNDLIGQSDAQGAYSVIKRYEDMLTTLQ
jgi:PTS system fructose-specific IIC component/PTS system nitrogen regulatory IIA component